MSSRYRAGQGLVSHHQPVSAIIAVLERFAVGTVLLTASGRDCNFGGPAIASVSRESRGNGCNGSRMQRQFARWRCAPAIRGQSGRARERRTERSSSCSASVKTCGARSRRQADGNGQMGVRGVLSAVRVFADHGPIQSSNVFGQFQRGGAHPLFKREHFLLRGESGVAEVSAAWCQYSVLAVLLSPGDSLYLQPGSGVPSKSWRKRGRASRPSWLCAPVR